MKRMKAKKRTKPVRSFDEFEKRYYPETVKRRCLRCGGTGHVEGIDIVDNQPARIVLDCPYCNGTGEIPPDTAAADKALADLVLEASNLICTGPDHAIWNLLDACRAARSAPSRDAGKRRGR